jgi:hypothetical protein
METSTKRTGIVILVGALILIAIIAMGVHYSRTGRLLPTGNELRRDANIAGQRVENGLNNAGNTINNGINGAGAAVNNGLRQAGDTMDGVTTPRPMQTMMPPAEPLR